GPKARIAVRPLVEREGVDLDGVQPVRKMKHAPDDEIPDLDALSELDADSETVGEAWRDHGAARGEVFSVNRAFQRDARLAIALAGEAGDQQRAGNMIGGRRKIERT